MRCWPFFPLGFIANVRIVQGNVTQRILFDSEGSARAVGPRPGLMASHSKSGCPDRCRDGVPRGALQLDCRYLVRAHSLDQLTDGDVDRSRSREVVHPHTAVHRRLRRSSLRVLTKVRCAMTFGPATGDGGGVAMRPCGKEPICQHFSTST